MRIFLVGAAVIVALVMMLGSTFVGAYNGAVQMEAGIEATASNNEQILGQFYNKLDETVQVSAIYKDDFKEVMTGMLAGRYGENGSQAAFQWIQESMPNLDPTMYRSIQILIEADRNRFQNEQQKLIDQRRQYDVRLKSFPNNVVLGLMGFPKLNLNDPRYNAVVTADASEVFETGVEEARELR